MLVQAYNHHNRLVVYSYAIRSDQILSAVILFARNAAADSLRPGKRFAIAVNDFSRMWSSSMHWLNSRSPPRCADKAGTFSSSNINNSPSSKTGVKSLLGLSRVVASTTGLCTSGMSSLPLGGFVNDVLFPKSTDDGGPTETMAASSPRSPARDLLGDGVSGNSCTSSSAIELTLAWSRSKSCETGDCELWKLYSLRPRRVEALVTRLWAGCFARFRLRWPYGKTLYTSGLLTWCLSLSTTRILNTTRRTYYFVPIRKCLAFWKMPLRNEAVVRRIVVGRKYKHTCPLIACLCWRSFSRFFWHTLFFSLSFLWPSCRCGGLTTWIWY